MLSVFVPAVVLEVVTQGSNARALRAYERAGFTTQQVAYWYHAWR